VTRALNNRWTPSVILVISVAMALLFKLQWEQVEPNDDLGSKISETNAIRALTRDSAAHRHVVRPLSKQLMSSREGLLLVQEADRVFPAPSTPLRGLSALAFFIWLGAMFTWIWLGADREGQVRSGATRYAGLALGAFLVWGAASYLM